MNLKNVTPSDVRDQAEFVLDFVGPTLMSLACGAPDHKTVQQWADGTSVPDEDDIERLATCHEVLRQVANFAGDDVARGWFVGANWGPDGTQAPWRLLRFDNLVEVRTAAALMVDEGVGY